MNKFLNVLIALMFCLSLVACKDEAPAPAPAEKPAAKQEEAAKPVAQQEDAAKSEAKPAKEDPLAAWKPKFDPSGAEYTYILSNISHPVIEGIAVGYRIRDRVWDESSGRLYVDFRPLAQMGGEKDVINKLKLGAVQGMMSSSVAAQNVADTLGIVNLPYIVDTFDKLDKFRNTAELWEPFANSALSEGIMVADVTGYGPYGWATTTPVQTLEDAKTINFRIAEAPVNADFYNAWGMKFTVMPWPDVPQALQTGVITGLDHTAIVCNITKKFNIAKNFTELDYAQGLFIHLINKKWFESLPADLQEILTTAITEESAKTRELTKQQHEEQVAKAKEAGVAFFRLSDEEKQQLIDLTAPVYQTWGEKIGKEYFDQVQAALK
jgi:TRAP-type C4-dicarboxylate transport system substrate-binding protein